MGKTILLVSSESRISAGVTHVFISEGHSVVASSDSADALGQVAEGGFDVGLIDAEFVGVIGGAALARRFAELAPGMKVFLIAPGAPRLMGKKITFLPKPRSLSDVRRIVQVVGK